MFWKKVKNTTKVPFPGGRDRHRLVGAQKEKALSKLSTQWELGVWDDGCIAGR
jgi:hypothetical protein